MKKYNLIHFDCDDYKITEETKNKEVIVKEYKYRKCAENWLNKQKTGLTNRRKNEKNN